MSSVGDLLRRTVRAVNETERFAEAQEQNELGADPTDHHDPINLPKNSFLNLSSETLDFIEASQTPIEKFKNPSLDLMMNRDWFPDEMYQGLHEKFSQFHGKDVQSHFQHEMAGLVMDKVFTPMKVFKEDNEENFVTLGNYDQQKRDLGRVEVFSKDLSSQPGCKRRELNGHRIDQGTLIMTNIRKRMQDFRDDDFITQMREEIAEGTDSFHEAITGQTQMRQEKVDEFARIHSEVAAEFEEWNMCIDSKEAEVAAKLESEEALIEQANVEAEKAHQTIVEACAMFREAARKGCEAMRKQKLLKEQKQELDEHHTKISAQWSDHMVLCESRLTVARTELGIHQLWENWVPNAYKSIGERLQVKVKSLKEKFPQDVSLFSDLYLCLHHTITELESEYKDSASRADEEARELDPKIKDRENVGDPADVKLSRFRQEREQLWEQNQVMKEAVRVNAEKGLKLETLRIGFNDDFGPPNSTGFREVETDPRRMSKCLYDVFFDAAEHTRGIREIFFTKEALHLKDPWYRLLDEKRAAQKKQLESGLVHVLSIKDGGLLDSTGAPGQDLRYQMSAINPALNLSPDRLAPRGLLDSIDTPAQDLRYQRSAPDPAPTLNLEMRADCPEPSDPGYWCADSLELVEEDAERDGFGESCEQPPPPGSESPPNRGVAGNYVQLERLLQTPRHAEEVDDAGDF